MPNGYSGPGGPGAEQTDDALPPTLSALDALLRQDGAHWRETAPNPARWLPDLRTRSAESAQSKRTAAVTMLSERHLTFGRSSAPTTPRHVHRPSRLGTVAAGGSALLVVALLAVLLHGLVGTRGTTTAQKTSAATPKTLQPASAWTTYSLLDTNLAAPGFYTVPSVAPGDPSIIYLTDESSLTLKRSADGGKTWHALAVPTADVSADLSHSVVTGVAVSPVDPQTVFLTISSSMNNPKCPAYTRGGADKAGGNMLASPQSGDYSCTFQYISHDGGATWTKMSIPDNGRIGAGYTQAGSVYAQGSRLFTLLGHDANGSVTISMRLVASDDGGNTWIYDDQNLYAQGRTFSTFLPDAGGRGAWALTFPPNYDGQGTSIDEQLWRTDDGTTWHKATLPAECQPKAANQNPLLPEADCMLTGAALVGTSPVVDMGYIGINVLSNAATSSQIQEVVHYLRSTDDGQTWRQLPTVGLPPTTTNSTASFPPMIPVTTSASSGVAPVPYGDVTLADGTLIVYFAHQGRDTVEQPTTQNGQTGTSGYSVPTMSDITYYALLPGAQTWLRIAPPLTTGVESANLVVPRSGGGYSLVVLAQDEVTGKLYFSTATLGLG